MTVSELIEILPGATPVTVQSIRVWESEGTAVRNEYEGTAAGAVRENRQNGGRMDRLRVIEATVRGTDHGNGTMTIVAVEADIDDD